MDLCEYFSAVKKKQQENSKHHQNPHLFCITSADRFYLEAGMCLWRLPRTTLSTWWLLGEALVEKGRGAIVECALSPLGRLEWTETCSVEQCALFLCWVQVPLTRASALAVGVVSTVAANTVGLWCGTMFLFIICLFWSSIHSGTRLVELRIFPLVLLILASGHTLLYFPFLFFMYCIFDEWTLLLICNVLHFTCQSILNL